MSYRQVTQFTNLLAAAQGGISARGADNRPPNPILNGTKARCFAAVPAATSFIPAGRLAAFALFLLSLHLLPGVSWTASCVLLLLLLWLFCAAHVDS